MDREELVGIQTIWWVDYQLAVGFLTGSWKSNMDVWISNQLFGNPTACLSWPRCNGEHSTYHTRTKDAESSTTKITLIVSHQQYPLNEFRTRVDHNWNWF